MKQKKENKNQKVIGYYDEDGFAYCVKHARDKSDAIIENHYENCCICGVPLSNEN